MMKYNQKYVLFTALMLASFSASSDSWFSSGKSGVAPVTNTLYAEECGGCHFAYQPGLLPTRSWKMLFSNLEDHFGENAELDKKDTESLVNYAMENGADKSAHKRSVKINRSISGGDTPLRITDVSYIKRKHRELSQRHVEKNPKVESLSRCQACHTKVESGSFSEREINIPNFGRWED